MNSILFDFVFSFLVTAATAFVVNHFTCRWAKNRKCFFSITLAMSAIPLLITHILDSPPEINYVIPFGLISGYVCTIFLIYLMSNLHLKKMKRLFHLNFSGRSEEFSLRELYHLACRLEQEGEAFYRDLSRKYPDSGMAALCIRLADDENRHLRALLKQLYQWPHKVIDEDSMSKLTSRLESMEIFSQASCETERELLEYAIAQEIKTAEFYLQFGEQYRDAWKSDKILQLHIEELGHVKGIKSYLKELDTLPQD